MSGENMRPVIYDIQDPVEGQAVPAFEMPTPICSCERSRSFRLDDPESRPEVTSPDAAAQIFIPLLRGLDREHAMMLSLDSKHRLIAATLVSVGSVDHTFMSPREIFRDALAHGASAIVIAHNHPSGDARPSRDDREVTLRLTKAGLTIGVNVLDHLIIGSHDWMSMAREGTL